MTLHEIQRFSQLIKGHGDDIAHLVYRLPADFERGDFDSIRARLATIRKAAIFAERTTEQCEAALNAPVNKSVEPAPTALETAKGKG